MLCAIDVGHLGKPQSITDKGAAYEKICEGDMVLLYAVLTRGMLELKGINTVLLTYDSYFCRQSFCKKIKADLHLQCHLNAAKGKYGLVLYRESNADRSLPLAMKMANQFEKNLPISMCKVEGMKDNDSRCGCISNDVPSLLLEPLFLDNPDHHAFIKSDDGLVIIANSITQAILEWEDK